MSSNASHAAQEDHVSYERFVGGSLLASTFIEAVAITAADIPAVSHLDRVA